jgi:hypothetical protein
VKDTLKSVLRDENPPFQILFDPESDVVGKKYGTHLVPETWLIDKRGVIRARFDGARRWTDPTVIELVDQLRSSGYCSVQVKEGQPVGEGRKICDSVTGG